MRVIDCDECGETIRGADDSELAENLRGHYAQEHTELSAEDAGDLVAGQAYDATDS
jgi:hypothetical protein